MVSYSAPESETSVSDKAATHGEPSRLELLLRALRHRNFRLFFAGQLISLIGTWMQSIAQSWLVYRLTGSALLLGSVGFAGQIPVFLLAPIGGIVADRYSRHRVVVGTQTSSMILAFVLAILTLGGWVQVWQIFVLSSLLGSVNAFDIPARQAFIVEMVGREDLMNAIALNSSMFNSARILGPAVAGVLVAKIGEGWCFFANGVSYIAVITGLLLMHLRPAPSLARSGSPLHNMLEGFRFVRTAKPIRALLLMLGLVSLVGMPYSVLMPIFADKILHSGARGLGILMGATGVGALFGALSLAARSGLRGLAKWVGYSCAGIGLSLIVFSLSHSFWLSVTFLLPVGFAMMVQMGSCNTLIQSMVPDRLRGRVMAVYSMMFMGMAPFGAFFAGLLAEKFGAPLTVSLGALICLAGSAAYLAWLPGLRAEARSLIVAQGTTAESSVQEVTVRTTLPS
ncbi:MAG TPA: MFS transporter [Acidobacteriota bacterium]|nr:MFS transporter [Acidobacteriota bacterium]